MRERNPCLRLRRRTFGWYVRFIEKRFLGKSRFERQHYGRPETLSKLGLATQAQDRRTAKSRSRSRNINHSRFGGNGPFLRVSNHLSRPENIIDSNGFREVGGSL